MTALSEVSKRGPRLTPEQKAEKKKQQTQARVGLASNVLGLSAGAAATGAALRDPRFADEKAGKTANWIARQGKKIPQPIAHLTRNFTPKKAAALAGGALALQAANVGGDVVANRVLARSAQTDQAKVKKNDGTWTEVYISKADHTSGFGKAHQDMSDDEFEGKIREATSRQRKGLVARGATSGAILGGMTGAMLPGRSPKNGPTMRRLGIGATLGGAAMGGLVHRANEKQLQRIKEDPVRRYRGEIALHNKDRLKQRALEAQARRASVDKAYRRYDPEADRQRRLGLMAGTGVAGGALLGSQAAKQFTTKVGEKEGHKLRGIAVRPKRGKAAALYTLGALGASGAGIGAYRKGVSERNNPWN